MVFRKTPPGAPAIRFPALHGDPVNLLWLVPITAAERVVAQRDGSETLVESLSRAGHDFIHRDRAPVA